MTYQAARALEIREAHLSRIRRFVPTYRPGRKTIVLLPGGMGSQLDRSVERYRDDMGARQFTYDPVWIDTGLIFSGDGLKLEIARNGRDQGDHIVIPDGPLRFLVNPYDGTVRYLREVCDYNVIVFGFDWRRGVAESAGHLADFLRVLRQTVKARHGGHDPIPETSLVAHSMGGQVAAFYLHRRGNLGPALEHIITVATPFYANSTHTQRYFKGEKLLNILHGSERVVRIVGSIPGPYVLLFMDKATYARVGDQLGLEQYPVRDADDPGVEVDPFDPGTLDRYPPWVKRSYIELARDTNAVITRASSPGVADKIFHIRGVKNTDTLVELTWKDGSASEYDPEGDDLPIGGIEGEGDGTVPAWAARLASTPAAQVYDLQLADDHMSLMEHEETLRAIRIIVETGVKPAPGEADAAPVGVFGAPSEMDSAEAAAVVQGVADGRIDRSDPRCYDPAFWRTFMKGATLC